jgi:lysophospholipase L1-like esterase
VHRLWAVGQGSLLARGAWRLLHICQALLANPTSTAPVDAQRRDRVRQRVIDYNTQLAQACEAYGPNCAFDHNAVFNYPFTLDHISGWDFFHPNATGQRELAAVTWQVSGMKGA